MIDSECPVCGERNQSTTEKRWEPSVPKKNESTSEIGQENETAETFGNVIEMEEGSLELENQVEIPTDNEPKNENAELKPPIDSNQSKEASLELLMK